MPGACGSATGPVKTCSEHLKELPLAGDLLRLLSAEEHVGVGGGRARKHRLLALNVQLGYLGGRVGVVLLK